MSSVQQTSGSSIVHFEETPIERLPHARRERNGRNTGSGAGRGRVHSGDANRYAYLVYDGEHREPCSAVVDGHECPAPCQGYSPFQFSPDGHHMSYAARGSDGMTVVCDGVEGRSYTSVVPPVWAGTETCRCAYVAHRGGIAMTVCDGAEGPAYEETGGITFSPSGTRLAYWGRSGASVTAVIEGLENAVHTSVSDITFSPGGERVAYVAGSGEEISGGGEPSLAPLWVNGRDGRKVGRVRVVVDGELGPYYDDVSDLQFSADGGRFAYLALSGDCVALIINGDELARRVHSRGHRYELGFSVDGRHMAAILPQGDRHELLVDGEVIARHGRILRYHFSPGGDRLIYLAQDDGTRFAVLDGVRFGDSMTDDYAVTFSGEHCLCEDNDDGLRRVYLDGQFILTYYASDYAYTGTLSPDAAHIAAGAAGGEVILDGCVVGDHERLPSPGPVFSPDGEHLAWAAWQKPERKMVCVVDGLEGPMFNTIGTGVFNPNWGTYTIFGLGCPDENIWVEQLIPGFSLDSRHLAYVASSAQSEVIVVDGVVSPAYDELVIPPDDPGPGTDGWGCPLPFVWEASGLRFMAVRDNILYRVLARLGDPDEGEHDVCPCQT